MLADITVVTVFLFYFQTTSIPKIFTIQDMDVTSLY